MTTSTKHIQKKATQHFILLVLCCVLFVTITIAWYKQHEINEYQRNAPTTKYDFIRKQYEESENIRFYYTLGVAIMENPLMHMLEAYWAYGIAHRGYRGFRAFLQRCFN
ncbi:MAG: hypothetical protein AAF900_01150 [Bacteroidota bacterium]